MNHIKTTGSMDRMCMQSVNCSVLNSKVFGRPVSTYHLREVRYSPRDRFHHLTNADVYLARQRVATKDELGQSRLEQGEIPSMTRGSENEKPPCCPNLDETCDKGLNVVWV